jgi:hypothetical protein
MESVAIFLQAFDREIVYTRIRREGSIYQVVRDITQVTRGNIVII